MFTCRRDSLCVCAHCAFTFARIYSPAAHRHSAKTPTIMIIDNFSFLQSRFGRRIGLSQKRYAWAGRPAVCTCAGLRCAVRKRNVPAIHEVANRLHGSLPNHPVFVCEEWGTGDNGILFAAHDERRDGLQEPMLHEPVVARVLAHQPCDDSLYKGLVVSLLHAVPHARWDALERIARHLYLPLVLTWHRAQLLNCPVNLISQRVLPHAVEVTWLDSFGEPAPATSHQKKKDDPVLID